MDSMSPITEHQVPSKVHTWMLILLGWTAVFSLIAVGLLLTKQSPSISSSEIALACQNGAMNGITTNLTRISETCAEAEGDDVATMTTVKGTRFYPGFTLPVGWHIAGDWLRTDTDAEYEIEISLDPLIINYFDSDAPSATMIRMVTANPLTVDAEKQAEYVYNIFNDSSFSNTETNSTSLPGGILYTTKTIETSELRGAREMTVLHFFGASTVTSIDYYNGVADDAWSEFVKSLDWSTLNNN